MTVGGVDGGRFQVQEIAPFVRQDIFQIPRAASSAFTLHIAKLAQPPAHLMDTRHIAPSPRGRGLGRGQSLQPVYKQAVSFRNRRLHRQPVAFQKHRQPRRDVHILGSRFRREAVRFPRRKPPLDGPYARQLPTAAAPVGSQRKQLRNMLEARHLRLRQNSRHRRLLRHTRFRHYQLDRRQNPASCRFAQPLLLRRAVRNADGKLSPSHIGRGQPRLLAAFFFIRRQGGGQI